MKQIVENILQRLVQECPALALIDKDCGQLLSEQPPTQWPCALVDVREAAFSNAREGYQSVALRIAITVADLRTAQPDGDPLRVLEAIAQVSTALQGWCPAVFCRLLTREELKRKYLKHAAHEVYRLDFCVRYGEEM